MKIFKRKVSKLDEMLISFLENGVEKLAEAQQKEFFIQKEIERKNLIKERFEYLTYLKINSKLTIEQEKEFSYVEFMQKKTKL